MGFVLFLILACGLPGLMLLSIRRQVPDRAWAGFARTPAHHAPPVEPGGRHPGYVGGATDDGSSARRPNDDLSRQGADIEHGLTRNDGPVAGKDPATGGVIPDGNAPDYARGTDR
ncbi:hypothetical protein [Methylobacterium nonmethylotrophicum]|uniref:Uncharacterized protein n=1 Tax=Methylobacterium nonmethylotrophicum TaxID=1141884 RepID=A0A4Z0NIJ4_9HYPH|nr:hypothetical protein [Methylobacterium nonmethylotrophicum]TGD95621.1 hypothetical protein EU555_27290 [Methylobacterium nonmethylotrophicum]